MNNERPHPSLYDVLGFYQQTLSTARQVGQQNIQQGAQATQRGMQAGVQAASQAGQQTLEVTRQPTQQGAQATSQTAQQAAQAANQSAQQGARSGEQIAQAGALAAQRVATGVPIRDYDDLNVGDLVEQLDNLSVEELQAARTYEQENKNRDTLLEQIDRRLNAAS
jgi:hypothetical protein